MDTRLSGTTEACAPITSPMVAAIERAAKAYGWRVKDGSADVLVRLRVSGE